MAEVSNIDMIANPRGIPSAVFIEDVPTFVGDHFSKTPEGAEATLKRLHELYGKYKFMESKLIQQKRALLAKIPEIKNALNVLEHLKDKTGEIPTQFELSDAIYVKATITKTDNVMLWLGANVMVEYPIDEAIAVLSKNSASAEVNLRELNVDIEFLKDQITVTEVNIARIHNYKVQLNQALKNKK